MTIEELLASPPDYLSDDENTERLIVRTISRLPPEVAEFAVSDCRFISIGRTAYGVTFPGRVGAHGLLLAALKEKRPLPEEAPTAPRWKWVIVLSEHLPDNAAEGIIAHEIAHAFLQHDRLGEAPADCEEQAASLVHDWGFAGIGADAAHCSAGAK